MFICRNNKKKDNQSKSSSKENSPNDVIECTSLNIEMTDKNFETADFTSSEKQVRFSMTTIRTPPSSPKPPNSKANPERQKSQDVVPMSNVNKKNFMSPSQIEQIYPEITKHLQEKMGTIENIKVNFLERLEVLPESKA